MSEQKVIIEIDPKDASVKFHVEGVQGGGCTSITEALSKGHNIQDSGHTSEFQNVQEMPAYVEDL